MPPCLGDGDAPILVGTLCHAGGPNPQHSGRIDACSGGGRVARCMPRCTLEGLRYELLTPQDPVRVEFVEPIAWGFLGVQSFPAAAYYFDLIKARLRVEAGALAPSPEGTGIWAAWLSGFNRYGGGPYTIYGHTRLPGIGTFTIDVLLPYLVNHEAYNAHRVPVSFGGDYDLPLEVPEPFPVLFGGMMGNQPDGRQMAVEVTHCELVSLRSCPPPPTGGPTDRVRLGNGTVSGLHSWLLGTVDLLPPWGEARVVVDYDVSARMFSTDVAANPGALHVAAVGSYLPSAADPMSSTITHGLEFWSVPALQRQSGTLTSPWYLLKQGPELGAYHRKLAVWVEVYDNGAELNDGHELEIHHLDVRVEVA